MALKKSGVVLVAEGYNEYMRKMRDINKAHGDAFGKVSTKGVASTKKELTGLNGILGDAIDGFTNMGPLIGRAVGAFTALGPAIAAVKLLDFVNQSSQLALTVETLDISLRTMANSVGYSTEQVDFAVASLKEQGITTQASIQALQRMTRAQISWAEASKLAAIAQGSAVGTTFTSSQAFERLVLGIQKMEPELLDELGITLRREVAYKQMAQQLGKNTKELTDAEKKQAILNQIYEQSAVVMDVYEASMTTAGKQQKTLARLQEETSLNVGQLTKVFATLSIEMQTKFAKAAQDASKGLALWGPIADQAITGLGKLQTVMDQMQGGGGFLGGVIGTGKGALTGLFPILTFFTDLNSIMENAGRQMQTWARVFVDGITIVAAGFVVLKNEAVKNAQEISGVWQKVLAGDFAGAWTQATSIIEKRQDVFVDNFGKVFQAMMDKNHEKFPDLYKAWDDIGKVAEVSLDLQKEGTEDTTAAVEELTAALEQQLAVMEAQKGAFEKAKNIQETFTQAVEKAGEDRDKALADATEKFNKDQAEMTKRHNEEIITFDIEAANERLKMLDDEQRQVAQARDAFNRDQKQSQEAFSRQQNDDQRKFQQTELMELQRHQLAMDQARRRQSVSDRRLRAEGDVLALMQAREDFELQKQEAQENFDIGKGQKENQFKFDQELAEENFRIQQEIEKENFNIQARLRQEEFQRQLADFDAAKAAERERMLATQQQERDDLIAHFEEEKVQIQANYEEAMAAAAEQRDKQLQALGDSLKAEGVVTEEGMKEIASKISEVFGDEGAGDQLIKGWADRTENKFSVLIDNLSGQIASLKDQMKDLEDGTSGGSSRPSTPASPGGSTTGRGHGRRRGMREGGSGVVTGPAVFEVEPGVREAYMFAPLPTGGSSNLNVQMSGGFDISGAEIAGKAAVAAALETMTENFVEAVQRLSRRRG